MSRQFFNTLVGMWSRSHDFDDGLKINFNFNKLFMFTTAIYTCISLFRYKYAENNLKITKRIGILLKGGKRQKLKIKYISI